MNKIVLCLLCAVVATGCTTPKVAAPEKTQLEIREFQTRTYDLSDKQLVLKSVLNVLQDDGYMVKSVNSELGFLSATKEIGFRKAANYSSGPLQIVPARFGVGFGAGTRMRWPRMPDSRERTVLTHRAIESTVNVTEFGDKVRVRASFQGKVFDSRAAVVDVRPIEDAQFYQNFFSKVDKGIFLQQQNI